MWTKYVTPRSIVAATAVASLVVVGTLGSIGVQSYVHAQESAVNEMEALTSEITSSVDELSSNSGSIYGILADAQATLDASNGKTLDNTARDELNAAITEAHAELDDADARASELEQKLAQAQRNFEDKLLWPPDAEAVVEQLHEQNLELDGKLNALMTRVAEAQSAVKEAQAAWQAEQDRIAAEAAKAAAEAAARRAKAASAGSTLRPSGGSTAPNVQQAPPAAPVEPSTSGTTVATNWAESFLRQYVSPSQASLTWNAALCQPGYICGITTVGRGTPVITLMGSAQAPANYNWSGGRYVLVHEAAHARQYWLYGSVAGMIAGAERVTSAMGITGVAAVEYMADCSTIVKIGYAGTYTASCTPEQLTEAARVW